MGDPLSDQTLGKPAAVAYRGLTQRSLQVVDAGHVCGYKLREVFWFQRRTSTSPQVERHRTGELRYLLPHRTRRGALPPERWTARPARSALCCPLRREEARQPTWIVYISALAGIVGEVALAARSAIAACAEAAGARVWPRRPSRCAGPRCLQVVGLITPETDGSERRSDG